MKDLAKRIARNVLPASAVRRLKGQRHGADYHPQVGAVNFGDFRRLTPISRQWGYDRGTPIDRYHIEQFLARQADDIRGRVLEIGDNEYTRRFGGDRVAHSDVLHVVTGNPQATMIADLSDSSADRIPSNAFECFVMTQTLHLIFDVTPALRTAYRILKPGGVLLATFPGLSQSYDTNWRDRWYWGFTTKSARRLFAEVFGEQNITLTAHGNPLTAISYLQGLAAEELLPHELDYHDPDYELLITVRSVKPGLKG